MKKHVIILVCLILGGLNSEATNITNSNLESTLTGTVFARNYSNSFIFVEQGIEFAVFPDGQFDFNIQSHSSNFGAQINANGVSLSFNSGYRYNSFVQYDDYGAVVQIENIPVFYDYYGRIVQAGNIYINYNSFGRISRVGGLAIYYNRYNTYAYATGYINTYNRYYVSRPWHRYYATPIVKHCVVYTKPYRRYYKPVRYSYYGPYNNNYRPVVSYSAARRKGVSYTKKKQSDRYAQAGRTSKDSRLAYNKPKSRKASASSRSKTFGSKKYSDKSKSRKNVQSRSKSIKQNKVAKNGRPAVKQKQRSKLYAATSKSTKRAKTKRSSHKKRDVKSSPDSNKKNTTRRGKH